jgi:hypothetical protein
VFENLLCPLFLVLAIKSPALHVLRFNHERTVHRHSYMVDMSGTLTEARSRSSSANNVFGRADVWLTD